MNEAEKTAIIRAASCLDISKCEESDIIKITDAMYRFAQDLKQIVLSNLDKLPANMRDKFNS